MKKFAFILSVVSAASFAEPNPSLYNDMTSVRYGYVTCLSTGKSRVRSEGCYLMVEDRTFPEKDRWHTFEWNQYVTHVTGRRNMIVTGISKSFDSSGALAVDVYYMYSAGE